MAVVLVAAAVGTFFAVSGGGGSKSLGTITTAEGNVVVKAVDVGQSVGDCSQAGMTLNFNLQDLPNLTIRNASTGKGMEVCAVVAASGYQVVRVTLGPPNASVKYRDGTYLTTSDGTKYSSPYDYRIGKDYFLAFAAAAGQHGFVLNLPGAAPFDLGR
jgi:hypothetical protein